jgi:hypothetical protein
MRAIFIPSRRHVLGALLALGAVFRVRPSAAANQPSPNETVLVGRWILKTSDLS